MLICCPIWCDCYEVVKGEVQLSIVNLTAKTGNLVEEVVFGWRGTSSKDQLGFNKEFANEVKNLVFDYVRSNGDLL